MLIGPKGVGKSSLLHGLMNKKIPEAAKSTWLADTYWAKSTCGGYWVKITSKDEMEEFAILIKKAQIKIRSDEECDFSDVISANVDPCVKAIMDEIMDACLGTPDLPQINTKSSSSETDVYLRIWDCGSQSVFLNLLPALLTARTLYLLIFDARNDLEGQSLHISHFASELGIMTTLQKMISWMATIDAMRCTCSPVEEGTIRRYPRILPVGTHGDDDDVRARSKEDIFRPILEACANKGFTHLVLQASLNIVDNTTAGMGVEEDPAFRTIRRITSKFASADLAIPTPITWVLFRRVFEQYSRNKPVLLLHEVKGIASACLIPEDSITSVLEFYHDLSVFFHYTNVPSLASKVIADPQWLIKQIAKILAFGGTGKLKNVELWSLLREHGILVEHLYVEVLSTKHKIRPQDVIDLLEHFLILSPIRTKNEHHYKGLEYFVPCMLRPCTAPKLATGIKQSSDPLHLIFSTNYLPPGFFVRLVTAMSKFPKIHVTFGSQYRNAITFHYGASEQLLDEVLLTEMKSSICVQLQRKIPRSYKSPIFIDSCHQIIRILTETFDEVLKWFPGIDVRFAVQCGKCDKRNHFIPLPSLPCASSNPTILCQKNNQVKLLPAQFWFYTQEVSIEYNLPSF